MTLRDLIIWARRVKREERWIRIPDWKIRSVWKRLGFWAQVISGGRSWSRLWGRRKGSFCEEATSENEFTQEGSVTRLQI